MILNEQLKSIRKSLGLSQRAMGEKLGINRNIYADYELGRTRLPADIYVAVLALSATLPDKAGEKAA